MACEPVALHQDDAGLPSKAFSAGRSVLSNSLDEDNRTVPSFIVRMFLWSAATAGNTMMDAIAKSMTLVAFFIVPPLLVCKAIIVLLQSHGRISSGGTPYLDVRIGGGASI